ncbi:MAG: prolipoprotein diacylglyceryl transferase [Candidatus Omnitrophica bacterium]|nr:prolipoprotein diacylglyceryl transferase [Candidatus Omnitrophota bacterium]
MYPNICQIGPFTIYSYGLMLVAAFLTSSLLACSQAAKDHIDPETIFNLAFVVFICGVIGARIFYVLENIGYYLREPLEIIMLQHGGLSWFGGLALAIISGVFYLKKKGLPVYKVMDLIAPFVALGQAIGRIGCLLNGCCFGKTLIPIQAYSSLALVVIFILLRFLQDRPHKEGEIFFSYLLLYSLKRFIVEFWRVDNAFVFWHLTLFHIISFIVFIIAITKLIIIRRR